MAAELMLISVRVRWINTAQNVLHYYNMYLITARDVQITRGLSRYNHERRACRHVFVMMKQS